MCSCHIHKLCLTWIAPVRLMPILAKQASHPTQNLRVIFVSFSETHYIKLHKVRFLFYSAVTIRPLLI